MARERRLLPPVTTTLTVATNTSILGDLRVDHGFALVHTVLFLSEAASGPCDAQILIFDVQLNIIINTLDEGTIRSDALGVQRHLSWEGEFEVLNYRGVNVRFQCINQTGSTVTATGTVTVMAL